LNQDSDDDTNEFYGGQICKGGVCIYKKKIKGRVVTFYSERKRGRKEEEMRLLSVISFLNLSTETLNKIFSKSQTNPNIQIIL
jgi:hypothetical protein